MMLSLRDDLLIETFDSAEKPPNGLSGSTQNNEYMFCSDNGQRYVGEYVHPGGFFSTEKWKLVPAGESDLQNEIDLVNRVQGVDRDCCAFAYLAAL